MSVITSTMAAADVLRRNNVTVTGNPDGPVLLFAHGFGCDQNMWRRVLPAFVDDHRVVVFDHVGAGCSDLAAYDSVKYATLQGYADDVLEICEALDVRDVTLVAHSISAMIAVHAAVTDPTRLARLVLVGPSPSYLNDGDYPGGFSREDIDGLLESLDSNYFAWAAMMAPTIMGNPDEPELGEELEGSFCRTDPIIARAFAKVTFLSDSRALLPRVSVPALVLQCTADALAAPEVGRYVHEQMPGSSFHQLAATGHCPHVSAPTETSEAILRYLAASRP